MRDGYTHFPQKQREWRFFNASLEIPPTIVVIDGSGDITTRHRVPLMRIR